MFDLRAQICRMYVEGEREKVEGKTATIQRMKEQASEKNDSFRAMATILLTIFK